MNSEKYRAFLYFISGSIASALSFLLLPFFTHYLTPEALGKYSLFQLVMSAGIPLVSLSLSTVVGRQHMELDPRSFRSYFSSCFWISTVAFLVAAFIVWLCRGWLDGALQIGSFWVQVALVCALAQGMLAIMATMNTIQKRAAVYALWRIGAALSLGLAALAAIYLSNGGWQEIASAQAGVSLVLIVLLAAAMYRKGWLAFFLDLRDARHALAYSLPLVWHALAAMIAMQVSDRLFVNHYLGVEAVGIYHVAQQMSMAMWLFVNAINLAWTPWYYEKSLEGTSEAHFTIVRASYKLSGAMCAGAALCTGILWVLFPYIIDERFLAARPLLPILIMGYVFNGMYMIISTALFHHGDTIWVAVATTCVALLSLLFNALLVPPLGLWGAAISTMLSMASLFIIIWIMVIRRYSLPWFGRATVTSEH